MTLELLRVLSSAIFTVPVNEVAPLCTSYDRTRMPANLEAMVQQRGVLYISKYISSMHVDILDPWLAGGRLSFI